MKINFKFTALFALVVLIGCNNKSASKDISSNSKEERSDNSSSELDIFSSKTITYGEQTFDFSNEYSSIKINENHEEDFKKMFADSSYLKLESYNLEGYVGFDIGGIKLGSAKETGKLSFNFNYEISKITFSVSPYFKYDDYNQIMRIDDTNIVINGASNAVESVDYKTTIFYDNTSEKDLSKSIVIENEPRENTSGRLIIYSMIVTYIIA